MRWTQFGAAAALVCAGGLSGCAVESSAAPVVNRDPAWVGEYAVLGQPVSAAVAVRPQDESRLPAMDDLYDAVLEVTPEAMQALVADCPDLAAAELNSFTPDWLLEELPEGATWQHCDELDALLEEQDEDALIVDAFLDVEHHHVVLVLMEL